MTWNQRIAIFRFWWADNGATFGLPLAVAVLALVGVLFFVLRPKATGPGQEIPGRVISVVPPFDPRFYNQASVMVELADGQRLTLDVPPTQTCLPGATAVVTRSPTKGGQVHDLKSCANAGQKSG